MNIVVVLRALRDPASFTVNRKAQKVFVNREAYRLNPADHNALEAALALAVGVEGAQVAAISYGGEPAAEALYQARAMGASRALWIDDPAPERADGAVLTRVLLGALDYLGGADLVLLGASVMDADLAQVGPRLAAALDWPFGGLAWGMRPAHDPGRIVLATRAGGGEGFRAVSTGLPAVVSVAADSNKPRYAPAPSIMRVYAEAQAVEKVTPDELGLEAAALAPRVVRRGEAFPPERQLGHTQATTPGEAAQQLAAELRRRYGRREAGVRWIWLIFPRCWVRTFPPRATATSG
jgi:electron transfer flavoprotein alpha/beta subunit